MEISINNKLQIVSEQIALLSIITEQLGTKQNGVAIAVNDNVIPKANWETYFLKPNDTILIIKATQGG